MKINLLMFALFVMITSCSKKPNASEILANMHYVKDKLEISDADKFFNKIGFKWYDKCQRNSQCYVTTDTTRKDKFIFMEKNGYIRIIDYVTYDFKLFNELVECAKKNGYKFTERDSEENTNWYVKGRSRLCASKYQEQEDVWFEIVLGDTTTVVGY